MKKILIIEDEMAQQEAYRLKLGKKYDIDFVMTEAEMIGNLAGPNIPNLIILDIMLPGGKNGFDLLTTLKENPKTSSIPVIMVTNLGEDQKQTALDCGAVEYLIKTNIGPEIIEETIAKYI